MEDGGWGWIKVRFGHLDKFDLWLFGEKKFILWLILFVFVQISIIADGLAKALPIYFIIQANVALVMWMGDQSSGLKMYENPSQ